MKLIPRLIVEHRRFLVFMLKYILLYGEFYGCFQYEYWLVRSSQQRGFCFVNRIWFFFFVLFFKLSFLLGPSQFLDKIKGSSKRNCEKWIWHKEAPVCRSWSCKFCAVIVMLDEEWVHHHVDELKECLCGSTLPGRACFHWPWCCFDMMTFALRYLIKIIQYIKSHVSYVTFFFF